MCLVLAGSCRGVDGSASMSRAAPMIGDWRSHRRTPVVLWWVFQKAPWSERLGVASDDRRRDRDTAPLASRFSGRHGICFRYVVRACVALVAGAWRDVGSPRAAARGDGRASESRAEGGRCCGGGIRVGLRVGVDGRARGERLLASRAMTRPGAVAPAAEDQRQIDGENQARPSTKRP